MTMTICLDTIIQELSLRFCDKPTGIRWRWSPLVVDGPVSRF